jgi:phosphate-selective porin OprO/OprP
MLRPVAVAVAAAALTLALGAPARAEDPPPDWEQRYRELVERQRQLDERLRAMEKRDDEERRAPLYGFGPSGFFIGRAADGTQARFHVELQTDGRAFFDDSAHNLVSQFVIRRARPIIDGTLGGILDFRVMPDFGQGTVHVVDAWVNLRPWKWLQLRAGKFKVAFGLERVQHDRYLIFLERGLPSQLTPDRDVGAMLHGEVARGAFAWQLGLVDGGPGNSSIDGDTNTAKDYFARVFAHPLRPLGNRWVEGLGVGFATTYGKERGVPPNSSLPVYRTAGQNIFFSYLPNVLASGTHYRLSPQLYYYGGRVGMLAEYVRTSTGVIDGGVGTGTIVNQAWQVMASVLVTRDRASYEGVVPERPFSWRKRQFGAVEVGARYGELRVGDTAFPRYADPLKSARQALEWGLIANWYWTWYARFGLQFSRTTFRGGGGAVGRDRPPEEVLIGRLQLAF